MAAKSRRVRMSSSAMEAMAGDDVADEFALFVGWERASRDRDMAQRGGFLSPRSKILKQEFFRSLPESYAIYAACGEACLHHGGADGEHLKTCRLPAKVTRREKRRAGAGEGIEQRARLRMQTPQQV